MDADASRRLLDPGDPPTSADVVIVGAGIAGLAFARELAARGVRDIVVVERGYPAAVAPPAATSPGSGRCS